MDERQRLISLASSQLYADRNVFERCFNWLERTTSITLMVPLASSRC